MRKKGANLSQQNCDPLDEDNDFTTGVAKSICLSLLTGGAVGIVLWWNRSFRLDTNDGYNST